ncbi:MAG: hypothetical protein O7G85_14900, partial [Planctomycetota bacterium]|nr:hypothetical protein [Planctomycetota bacterium]
SRLHTLGSLNATSASSIALNSADATLQVDGSLQLAANINLIAADLARVEVGGSCFSYFQTDENLVQLGDAIVQFTGNGDQFLEVGGIDIDFVVQILTNENFGFGQLIVGQPGVPTSVQLISDIDNGNSGGMNPEALYLFGEGPNNGLQIHSGSTLILTEFNLYVFDDDGLGASINGMRINDLFPAPLGDPNVLDWPGGGFVQLAAAHCFGDVDLSGFIDVNDLLDLLAAWGPCPGSCPADIDCDGFVNVVDLLNLLAGWGACP